MPVAVSVFEQASAWWVGISSLAPLAFVVVLVVVRLIREGRQQRREPLFVEHHQRDSDHSAARPE